MKQLMFGSEAQEEGLVVRGRTQERNYGGDERGKSKSKKREKTYNYCENEGTLNLSGTSCRIRIRKLMLIRREKN